MMKDPLKSIRQPLVTATGILLGFLLNVSGAWVSKAFSSDRLAEYFVAASVTIPIPLYAIVLFRILRLDYPAEKYEAYYKKTLVLFVSGVTISFLSLVAIMLESALHT